MAVYTSLTRNDISIILARYNIGTLSGFRGITQGVENTNYHVQTSKGRFILTLFENRVDLVALPKIFAFMNECRRVGVSCPAIMPTSQGALTTQYSGKTACIAEFLEGQWVKQQDLTPDHVAQMARILAQMHVVAEASDIQIGAPSMGPQQWRQLIEASGKGYFQTLYPDILNALDRVQDGWPSHLPSGPIHADLFPDNVFFSACRLSGVIDFYFAHNGPIIYDIAVAMNSWCVDEATGNMNIDLLHAFRHAYQEVRPLSPQEEAALPLMLCASCLRFLATRAYDWTHTSETATIVKKDPQEYIRKFKKCKGWL